MSGVRVGPLVAVLGVLFLALATWPDWPPVMRRVVCCLLALAWFSAAVWFCLWFGRGVEVPEGVVSSAMWRGWPFRFGKAAHGLRDWSLSRLGQFSVPAFVGDVVVGALIGLAPVLIYWLTRRMQRARPVAPKAAGRDNE
ncbi:MAG: hypothetical protein ACYSU0_14615 [Planctomycetota bacterium]